MNDDEFLLDSEFLRMTNIQMNNKEIKSSVQKQFISIIYHRQINNKKKYK